jgi:ribonucleoside-triphosphate reductase
MRERLVKYQEEYGDLYNLEATPAESTTYRLAKHDRERYPDIITAGKDGDVPFYTNSSHLPVEFTSDIFDALDIQDELQTLYTSGTVFHAFLGERLPGWKAAATLVRKIAENYKLPYYTMSPTYSICRNHGYLDGEQKVCPICGEKTEVYSRITGYYRPVQNWNDGKLQEFENRKLYDIEHSRMKKCEKKMYGAGSTVTVDAVQADTHRPTITPMAAAAEETPAGVTRYLFTTKTCPNCRMAKEMLRGTEYELIDAEEHPELVREFGIMQAPTLVVIQDGETDKYVNASNIKRYVDSRPQAERLASNA